VSYTLRFSAPLTRTLSKAYALQFSQARYQFRRVSPKCAWLCLATCAGSFAC
jgi:hypothetical protein